MTSAPGAASDKVHNWHHCRQLQPLPGTLAPLWVQGPRLDTCVCCDDGGAVCDTVQATVGRVVLESRVAVLTEFPVCWRLASGCFR